MTDNIKKILIAQTVLAILVAVWAVVAFIELDSNITEQGGLGSTIGNFLGDIEEAKNN